MTKAAPALAAVATIAALTGCRVLISDVGKRLNSSRRRGRGRRPDRSRVNRFARLVRAAGALVPAPARPSNGEDLQARLQAAGTATSLVARDWVALKSSCAIACVLSISLSSGGVPLRVRLILAAAAGLAGFLTPEAWLSRRIRRRVGRAAADLPDMLDLMRVSVGAGLPPLRALGVVAAEFDGPLASEWRRTAAEASLGIPAHEALAGLTRRLPGEEIRALCETLATAGRYGAPLASKLEAQARRARHRQAQRVREEAARAGPKIQLAVALLLVPSVLLIVAAGLVAELEQSGLGFGV